MNPGLSIFIGDVGAGFLAFAGGTWYGYKKKGSWGWHFASFPKLPKYPNFLNGKNRMGFDDGMGVFKGNV